MSPLCFAVHLYSSSIRLQLSFSTIFPATLEPSGDFSPRYSLQIIGWLRVPFSGRLPHQLGACESSGEPQDVEESFNVTAETIIISTKRSLRCFNSVLSWGYFDIIEFVDVTIDYLMESPC